MSDLHLIHRNDCEACQEGQCPSTALVHAPHPQNKRIGFCERRNYASPGRRRIDCRECVDALCEKPQYWNLLLSQGWCLDAEEFVKELAAPKKKRARVAPGDAETFTVEAILLEMQAEPTIRARFTSPSFSATATVEQLRAMATHLGQPVAVTICGRRWPTIRGKLVSFGPVAGQGAR